jgi:hypothetical protein
MDINNPTPAPHLPMYLLIYLPTHPSSYLPSYFVNLPTFYFLFPISYDLPTSYLSSYHLLPTS